MVRVGFPAGELADDVGVGAEFVFALVADGLGLEAIGPPEPPVANSDALDE